MNMSWSRPFARAVQARCANSAGAPACPPDWLNRHPFPWTGPRHPIPGNSQKENLDLPAQIDAVYLDEIRKGASTRSGRRSRCLCRCARGG